MKKKRVVLKSREICSAYYCPNCHLFAVDNGKPEYG